VYEGWVWYNTITNIVIDGYYAMTAAYPTGHEFGRFWGRKFACQVCNLV
jgi:hypothetical protein